MADGSEIPRQVAYGKAAQVADLLLRDGYPLVAFDAFDQGRMVHFVFDVPAAGYRERMILRAPTDQVTAEAIAADYRRKAA